MTQTQGPNLTAADASSPADARPAANDPLADRTSTRWRRLRPLLLVGSAILLAYLLLQNPYWVPGGDSDFYVTVARNLARGEGFTYNGAPVAISPPGWPWAMAVLMKISPSFSLLKLFTMGCMVGSLLISYFIALRFIPPRLAGIAIGLTAILFPLYSLTYFLHSEGLYCLLSAWALLIAFRVREQRAGWVERGLLVLLCVAIPFVRWAGLLQLLPIVAVLIGGPWRRDVRRAWVLTGLCCVCIVAVWYGTRTILDHRFRAFIESAQTDQIAELDTGADTSEGGTVTIIATGDAGRGMVAEYAFRFVESGRWFAWLLWYPTRFAGVSPLVSPLVLLGGWLVIGLLAYLTIVRTRQGDLLWAALTLYCGALCMNWPNANARYLVPIAPLILVGLLLALRTLGQQFPLQTIDAWKWLRRALIYSILLVNAGMYGVDVLVMRSANFYANFEAGQHKDLVDIAAYLNSLPPPPPAPATTQEAITQAQHQYRPTDGQVVVNERYENVGRVRMSKASTRAMALLTDRTIKPLDAKKSKAVLPEDPQPDGTLAFPGSVRKEIRRVGGRWLLVQTPVVPWRVWHFRLPRGMYEQLTKYPDRPDSGGWTLYAFDRINTTLTPQPVSPSGDWVTRVPGL